jgi:hypothetical protein
MRSNSTIRDYELHKLKTLIESKGGKVTDLNTDAIICTFEEKKLPFELSDGKNINGYYWDNNKTILNTSELQQTEAQVEVGAKFWTWLVL